MSGDTVTRSSLYLHPPGTVGRAGTATDERRQRSQEQEQDRDRPRKQRERRSAHTANIKRRRLFDLLFDEIEDAVGLNPGQRERLKRNLRARIGTGSLPPLPDTPVPPSAPSAEPGSADLADDLETVPPELPADPHHIAGVIAPEHPDLHPDEAAENAIIAAQLRDCLARRSETARKVAAYLHLLFRLRGADRPHFVLDI